MTMIDEDELASGLHDAADAMPVPLAAPTGIPGPTGPSGGRRTWTRWGLVAVAIAVMALAAMGYAIAATRPGAPVTSPASSPGSRIVTATGSGPVSRPARLPSPGLSGHVASAAGSSDTATNGPAQPASTVPPVVAGAGVSPEIEETGQVALGVGSGRLGVVLTQLTNIAVARGGFVASTQTQAGGGGSGVPSGSITLEVPEASFAMTVTQAQTMGKVTSLSTRGTDVTGQYIDLQARIAALEASRQQYLTILAKATTIGDILAVQSQLDTLQSELEQLQGQLQVLTSLTTYATLVVSVTEATSGHHVVTGAPSGLARAWHQTVSGFVDGFEDLVRVAGPALFALLCVAGAALVGRMAWRAGRRRWL